MANTYARVCQQTTKHARKKKERKYSSVSADYKHGSSGGEVDWWLVRCHGESGEVVDVSIFFHSFHSVLLVWWLGGWVMKLSRWLGG